MSTEKIVEFDQSKCVDKKWGHQHISKYFLTITCSILFKNYYLVSSFTTYPIEPVRDEVQKSPIKPPTITPKYDSNIMSTVVEWHVSFSHENSFYTRYFLG